MIVIFHSEPLCVAVTLGHSTNYAIFEITGMLC